MSDAVSFPAPTWQSEADDDVHTTMCSLQSLDALLPPSAVVCSGEDSHGVSQSSRFHSLMARYLALHSGMRTVVIEDMDADMAFVQAYVQTGDTSQLDRYWQGLTRSFGDVVEYNELFAELHDINNALPNGDTLAVRGMDVAVQVDGTLDRLASYLAIVNPSEAASLNQAAPRQNQIQSTPQLDAAATFVDGVAKDLQANESAYVAASDQNSWELAYEDALNLRDGYFFLSYYDQNNFVGGDQTYREPGLARNLERLAASATTPIMVIAHNEHCAKNSLIGNSSTVGTIVAQSDHLGSRFFVVAQAYAQGTETVMSQTLTGFATQSLYPSTLGPSLGKLNADDAYLLATTSTDFAMTKSWVNDYQDTVVPAKDFDVMAFIRNVTPTTLR